MTTGKSIEEKIIEAKNSENKDDLLDYPLEKVIDKLCSVTGTINKQIRIGNL